MALPIIERELRVALRKKRPARSRLITAAVCVGGTLLFLLMALLTGDPGIGRALQQALCLAGWYLVLQTMPLTAGVFAEERRNQTLGLLFVSGLNAGEVFASKVLSAALVALTRLLAMFPMLALPFLMGGVSFDSFLATVCSLPNLLLFAVSVTLLASVLTQDGGAAVVLAAVLGLLLCAVTPAFYFAQSHFAAAKPSLLWLRLSPAYGAFLNLTARGPFPGREVWSSFGFTLGWSVLCLGAAGMALKLLWRERPQGGPCTAWRRRWNVLVHGDAAHRRRLAAEWLEANPFVWLAARDRQPVALAWAVVGGIFALWLLCWAAWPRRWPSVPNLFFTATLINAALQWSIRHTAARSLGAGRHDGTYELLLTTPLQPSDIVWGALEALRRQFRVLGRLVLALAAAMMLLGLALRSWNEGALAVYFVAWVWLLGWAWSLGSRWRASLPVMWVSLNCGRPVLAARLASNSFWREAALGPADLSGVLAAWQASGFFWILLWSLYNLRQAYSFAPAFPTGAPLEILIAAITSLFLLPVILLPSRTTPAEWEIRLVSEFREIAREPVPEVDDPRFKRWDHHERFPWGWTLVQQQLHERLARRRWN